MQLTFEIIFHAIDQTWTSSLNEISGSVRLAQEKADVLGKIDGY